MTPRGHTTRGSKPADFGEPVPAARHHDPSAARPSVACTECCMAILEKYGHTTRQGDVRAGSRYRPDAGADRSALEGDKVRGVATCHPHRCHDGAGSWCGRPGGAGGTPARGGAHAAEGPHLGRDGSSRATCRIGPPRAADAVIHLDTSFLIHSLVSGSREDRLLRAWLRDAQPIGMSVVGWAEFLCGPIETTVIELAAHLVGEPEGFTAAACSVTAHLFNLSGRRRGSFTDCMIAAVAIRAGAALATSNRDDFARFAAAGLRLADH